ncbi:hypothetical protein PTKIN_Ptkin18bG0152000 [Pterospermum kingtungense]
MGAKASKQSNEREAKALSSNVGCSSQVSSIIKAIKPECMKKKKKEMVKRPSQSPVEKRITRVKKLTLEDWLLASPGHADCLDGGELYVFKHFSRRVHPSSSREPDEAIIPSDSFSLDLSLGDASCSSFSRSRSGKPKKKVSFRLPEETEIVIF